MSDITTPADGGDGSSKNVEVLAVKTDAATNPPPTEKSVATKPATDAKSSTDPSESKAAAKEEKPKPPPTNAWAKPLTETQKAKAAKVCRRFVVFLHSGMKRIPLPLF